MLFSSWTFVAFFLLVFGAYCMLTHRWQNRLLLIASYFFYAQWDWRFLGLIWLSTAVDYTVARRLHQTQGKNQRRILLGISIVTNLGILGYFKYADFFVESASVFMVMVGFTPDIPTLQIILPVGISFYTFQTLGYTIDVYRKQLKPETRIEIFALYVAFFPQLVAGPIERASRLLPQLKRVRVVTVDTWRSGSQLILWGYFKKVAIADSLSVHVDPIFDDPTSYTSMTLLLASYGFAIQIYADFSGYTDIARGISRLLGIELMENFRQPYFAQNIAEFWRRWHISLSTWLRDYLYIPLGGNRRGERRQVVNLMATMLLGGLWHGATWNFVWWGGLHGLYLAIHRTIAGRGSLRAEQSPRTFFGLSRRVLSICLTFHCVTLAWIVFRLRDFGAVREFGTQFKTAWIPNDALSSSADVPGLTYALVFFGFSLLLIDVPCWLNNREMPLTKDTRWWIRGVAYGSALAVLAFGRENHGEPFIYFQF